MARWGKRKTSNAPEPAVTVHPGQVFLPMHDPRTNRLMKAAFDPHSRQPSYKACAVRVAPA